MKLLDKLSLVRKLKLFTVILVATMLTAILLSSYLVYRNYQSRSSTQLLTSLSTLRSQLTAQADAQAIIVRQTMDEKALLDFMIEDHSALSQTFRSTAESYMAHLYQLEAFLPSSGLYLLTNNPTMSSYRRLRYGLDSAYENGWLDERIANPLSSLSPIAGTAIFNNKLCLMVCQGYHYAGPNNAPQLVVMSVRSIQSIFSQSSQQILLFSPEGEPVIWSPGCRESTLAQAPDLFAALGQKEASTVLNNSYTLSLTFDEEGDLLNGWTLIGVHDNRDIFSLYLRPLMLSLLIVLLVTFLLLYVTGQLNRNIIRRTEHVLGHIRNITADSFGGSIPLEGKDEFREIDKNLFQLEQRLKEMIEQEYLSALNHQKMQLAYQDQQIIALQNQINPHYIVNTLEVIRMKLLLSGQKESAGMVEKLAESLSVYAWAPRSTASLREEMAFIERFISLQNYRYLTPIRYEVIAEDSVLDRELPRFILQPIVENAIRHGFKNRVSSPALTFRFWEEQDYLFISVSNNGSALSEQELEALNRKIQDESLELSESGHIGLRNACLRLRLLYGEESGLKLMPGPDQVGITVLIRILQQKEGESSHELQSAHH